MSDITTTFAIVGAIVVLFVWDRLPVVLVALGTALALWATGILDLQQALGGLGDPTVIFIASLFVVSGALDATGVTAWAGKLLVARAGESRTRQLVLIMLLVAFLTALISVNGAVAALLPVVVVMAVRLGRPASQLLMPLVFAAHGGSMLAFTGTPVNVLVSEAATDAGVGPFGFFEFAWVGVPLLLGIIAIVILFGERLLPKRSGQTMPIDLSRHARTLIEHYRLDSDVVELRLRAASPWIGMAREAIDLAAWPGLNLVSVQGGDDGRPVHGRPLAEGDRVIVRGDAEAASRLAADRQLAFRDAAAAESVAETFFNRASGLAEVVIPPRSGLIGQDDVPQHDHTQRRPRGAVGAAARRGADAARAPCRGRYAAAPGHLEGARHAPRRPGRRGGRLARGRPPPGGAARRRIDGGHRGAARHGRGAGHRRAAAGRRGAPRGRACWCSSAWSRSSRPIARSTGRPSSSSAP